MSNTRIINASPRVWLASLLALLALPVAMLVAPVTAEAAGKNSVVMSVELKASPADVWKVVGAFDRLQDWHPAVADTLMSGSPTVVGSQRTLHLQGGGAIVEELTSYSDSNMRYTYAILHSPLPVANYESYLGVVDAGGGKSLVIWGSTFDAADGATDKKAKEVITGVYKAGLDNLKKKFGGVPAAKAKAKSKAKSETKPETK